jgi:hypothetical protein
MMQMRLVGLCFRVDLHAYGKTVWSWRQEHFLNYFKDKYSLKFVGPGGDFGGPVSASKNPPPGGQGSVADASLLSRER